MSLSLNDKRRPCAPISRRRLLRAGGIGGLTLGLPGMVAAAVNGNRGLGGGAAEKSCIFILLRGAPGPRWRQWMAMISSPNHRIF
jgi:hypothetical protein